MMIAKAAAVLAGAAMLAGTMQSAGLAAEACGPRLEKTYRTYSGCAKAGDDGKRSGRWRQWECLAVAIDPPPPGHSGDLYELWVYTCR
ncbi:hypothetical protein [Nonomuraea soli]|uniref:Uncharacterized protein n=1 Tax=Nonomuraea soli TaxID=1032476 RepID=A0A7W0HML0_9ACTN|nr:hypothetical protein [Nonomuraea soli]MBA2888865.1 hypothetical protein [Nonomuraea soli]